MVKMPCVSPATKKKSCILTVWGKSYASKSIYVNRLSMCGVWSVTDRRKVEAKKADAKKAEKQSRTRRKEFPFVSGGVGGGGKKWAKRAKKNVKEVKKSKEKYPNGGCYGKRRGPLPKRAMRSAWQVRPIADRKVFVGECVKKRWKGKKAMLSGSEKKKFNCTSVCTIKCIFESQNAKRENK